MIAADREARDRILRRWSTVAFVLTGVIYAGGFLLSLSLGRSSWLLPYVATLPLFAGIVLRQRSDPNNRIDLDQIEQDDEP